MVRNDAFSNKIALLVQELRQFCFMCGFFILDEVVKLVGGGSVINGAYPVLFFQNLVLPDR